jgi:hypothetical protein
MPSNAAYSGIRIPKSISMVADIQTPNQNALNKAPFSTQRNTTPPSENQT